MRDAVGSGSDAELVAAMTVRARRVVRRLDRVTVDAVAVLDRRGVFAERGYKSPVQAFSDLLGWEGFEARRRVVAAEQVTSRTGMDGAVCRPGCRPPRRCSPTAGRACGTSR